MRFYVRNPFFLRVLLVVALDFACLAVAAFVARAISGPELPIGFFCAGLVLVGAGSFLALQATGAYDLEVLGHRHRTFRAILGAMGIALVIGLGIYLTVPAPGSKEILARTALLFVPLLLTERAAVRSLSRRMVRRIVIVGASDLSLAIAEVIRARGGIGLQVVGFLSDEPDRLGSTINGVRVLGTTNVLEKVMRDDVADWVVVASKARDEHFPSDQLLQLKLHGTRVISGVDFYERITGEIYLRDLRASHLIFSEGFRIGRLQAFVKRAFDIALASFGLVVAAPVLLLAAAAIKLESRGPILFRQTRLGENDRPFELLKLRSMAHDAERATGAVFATRQDPRITRAGRIIRRTRIDELPQYWNVLKGDMSIVGPRPERPEFVEELSQRYPYFRLRSACRPGLTGWAQTRHGYVADLEGFEQKIALDMYYLKHRSIWLDLSIIWTTVRTVVTLSGV